jgi:hypothetical protein
MSAPVVQASLYVRWAEFASFRSDLADAGRKLLYQYGVGLAFLATSRADGGPRVHPMCPLLTEDELYGFIVPSPKRFDLRRDGRYALHSFPSDDNEDAFYIMGRAARVLDEMTEASLATQFAAERHMSEPPADLSTWQPYSFDIETCVLTQTTGHGDPKPRHTIWRATDGRKAVGGTLTGL